MLLPLSWMKNYIDLDVDIMEYMLKYNVKLEQEIVSWMNGVSDV